MGLLVAPPCGKPVPKGAVSLRLSGRHVECPVPRSNADSYKSLRLLSNVFRCLSLRTHWSGVTEPILLDVVRGRSVTGWTIMR